MRKDSLVYVVHRWMARTLFSMVYRIEIEREDHRIIEGPAVILPKHQYWTDIPVVGISFDERLCFVAKQELFRFPGVRSYLRILGGIPLDRNHPIRTLTSFRCLLARLNGAEKAVLFPEGTYVRGKVGPGKSRLIRMILGFQEESGRRIPFIPMGIRYGERKGWKRTIEVRIGHPLFAEKAEDAAELMHRVMEEIGRLSRLPKSNGVSIFEFSIL